MKFFLVCFSQLEVGCLRSGSSGSCLFCFDLTLIRYLFSDSDSFWYGDFFFNFW